MTVFRTALYIRLSREDGDREESYSVENQRKFLLAYLERQEDMELQGIYVDDGYTGTDFCRPGFQDMLARIQKGEADCVAVKDLSRFGRDYIETGRYLEREFPRMGVRFVAVADGIDSSRQAYDMLLPIKNIFNEQYARDISRKIRATVRMKQEAGEFIGAFACYGYRKASGDKNRLAVDEYAAGIVRRIYAMYLGGMGKRAIAAVLNGEGVPCPSRYKELGGEKYRNPRGGLWWTYSTIHGILRNEMYTGTMVQGKKRQVMRGRQQAASREQWVTVPGTHEPIISRDCWERVQELSAGRQQAGAKKREGHIFSGLIKCGDCGSAMVKNSWKRAKGERSQVFYCGTYKRQGKDFCTSHAVPLEAVREAVLGELQRLLGGTGEWRRQIGQWTQARKEENSPEARRAETGLKRMKAFKKRCYEDYREGLLSREEYLAYREDYEEKERLYAMELETLREEKETAEEDPWLWQLLETGTVELLDRESLVEMVQEILVYEGGRIRICYRF